MDIGSAASVGDGLGVLESSIQLTNILDALSVVVTTIEHSDVSGGPGGYSILPTPMIPPAHWAWPGAMQGRYTAGISRIPTPIISPISSARSQPAAMRARWSPAM